MNRSDESREVRPGLGGAGNAKSPSKARSTQSEHDSEAKASGPAEHESSAAVKDADSDTDNASAKANRKEAYEGEREHDEEAAIGAHRDVTAKHVMGTGSAGNVYGCHVMGGEGERQEVHIKDRRGKVPFKHTV